MEFRVHSIFKEIQGESSYSGIPFSFVRFAGCLAGCSFCDTAEARPLDAGTVMNDAEIIERLDELGIPRVAITGGEPLLQEGIIGLLGYLAEGYETVLLFTGNTVPAGEIDPRIIKIIDIKTPSSGAAHLNVMSNLETPGPRDEFKFVISDRDDFEWALAIIEEKGLAEGHIVHLSPAWNQLPPSILAAWIMKEAPMTRLHLQIHKLIEEPPRSPEKSGEG